LSSSPVAQSENLIQQFRRCSQNPALGTCKINSGNDNREPIDRFLSLLATTITHGRGEVPEAVEGLTSIQDSGVRWQRKSYKNVFPFYMESLTVAPSVDFNDDSLPVSEGFPGQWTIAEQVFDSTHAFYFENNLTRWQQWAKKQAESSARPGGLSFNVLEVPANSLHQGDVDVRPLTLHALAPDGRATDRGDVASQTAIANAFWQTFWATGATRAERGAVFPVAFFPVDRSSAFEFQQPFHERYVSLRRRFFGRSAICGYVLEALTRHNSLLFDTADCRFKITYDFDPEAADVSSADVLLAIHELNRTGFIDAFIGANKDTFASWTDHENRNTTGQGWPYDAENWNQKIKAAGHSTHDFLAKIRAEANSQTCHVIRRVVPFAGCAYLYQVMLEMDRLIERGKVQDFEGELIGATNSTFFLNFPEEYSALHSAMNEPVSLLVESGITRQIKTLKRAAFVLTENGEAFITTRAGNRLNSEVLVFEGESSSTTYFEKADRSFRKNTFGPLFFGAAVVGNSIVETFEEIKTEVPPAGWLIGDSEAFGGRIDPSNAAEVQVRQPGSLDDVSVRHAFAIGPLLMTGGEIIPLDQSREEFASIKLNKALTFEETSTLARTQLPEALLDCDARGVPPTRFPYDWDQTRAPRSAIGVKEDGSVIVVVVDGRADLPHSVGATLAELAVIMKSLGCRDAMNMDGGGSSVMFINADEAKQAKLRSDLRDGIVSLPSDMGGVERLLPVPLVICKRK